MCKSETSKKIEEMLKNLEDGVYIVQKGIVTNVSPKNFGHDTFIWRNGEVFDIERTEKIRLKV